jgi:hypothetical protein
MLRHFNITAKSTITSLLFAALVPVMAAAAPQGYGQQRYSQQQRQQVSARTIDAGTVITVRTNETIDASDTDGRIFTGIVEEDVRSRNGNVAIPRGSDVEMLTRVVDDDEIALDLDTIIVNGQRYGLVADSSNMGSERKEGIGANKRTGKYVGGGALLGAIIGAVAGGGKGAAIGAGVGAAAGAGTQVLTRGDRVHVPSESLLTFRLAEPLEVGAPDISYSRDGRRFRGNYPRASDIAYDNQEGQSYDGPATLFVTDNNWVNWRAPENVNIYVRVDNGRPQLFGRGPSGSQNAYWLSDGHVYTFVMRDDSGQELTRRDIDLRGSNYNRQNRYGLR